MRSRHPMEHRYRWLEGRNKSRRRTANGRAKERYKKTKSEELEERWSFSQRRKKISNYFISLILSPPGFNQLQEFQFESK
jgi:hypothetical protein